MAAFTLLIVLAAPVNAARPTVVVQASVNGTHVDISVSVNRAPSQIASCHYVLDSGSPTSCGNATPEGKKAATYDINLEDVFGAHSITVTILLTDGGRGVGSASFTAAQRTYARAFSNLDGLGGYDPAHDVLIAELVDSNGDNAVNSGDTLVTNRFPLNFTPDSFATAAVTTHVVVSVIVVDEHGVVVDDAAGNRFVLVERGTFDFENYSERTPDDRISEFVDQHLGTDCSLADHLAVSPASPSQPQAVFTGGSNCGSGDDSFLDVTVDLPAV